MRTVHRGVTRLGWHEYPSEAIGGFPPYGTVARLTVAGYIPLYMHICACIGETMSDQYILIDFIKRIKNSSIETATHIFQETLARYGYRELYYGISPTGPSFNADDFISIKTQSSPWLDYYTTHELYASDYIVDYCLKRNTEPLLTSYVHHLADTGALPENMIATSRLQRDAGYCGGVTIPLALNGPYVAGLDLSVDPAIPAREHDAHFNEHRRVIVSLADAFHACADRRSLALEHYQLTKREIEVLRFLAEGYRVKQISAKTGTHEDVIQRQIASARKRLNAATPIQAVAKAVALQVV